MIKSPCKNICRMDDDDKFCIGCHRTTNEIKNWSHYSTNIKLKLIKELRTRITETKKIEYYGNTV